MSIWDNFDLTKIVKTIFKLEFVAPTKQGESELREIKVDDISMKIDYCKHIVVCYVLGAHPLSPSYI